MGVLYIVSAEEGAGKTSICAGLAINLLNAGKKVGYLKPQATEKGQADGDIAFMGKVLGQSDVVNASDVIKGRDIVLVEARLGPSADDTVSKATYGAAKEMKAKAIAVEAYTGQASRFIEVYKGFGESLLGVVLNKVPQSQLKSVRDEATKQLGAAGIKVLGVIPENRILLAMTVGELAECIQGKILNSAGMSGETGGELHAGSDGGRFGAGLLRTQEQQGRRHPAGPPGHAAGRAGNSDQVSGPQRQSRQVGTRLQCPLQSGESGHPDYCHRDHHK